LNRTRLFFLLLAAVLAASRLCHTGLLWEGDTYPLAAAEQMLHGQVIYRDIWFDKPPLLPVFYLLWGAVPGWPMRLAGALYALAACWLAYRFARDLWSRREGLWAAGLMGFFLTFDFPSAVIPVASDLLMLAPHLAAVWLAYRRRPFWCGVVAAVAFWISPKGVFVAAACVIWHPAGAPLMAAGFAAASGAAVGALAAAGALVPYWNEVWRWGRLYAGSTFLASPVKDGILRTANWLGFHAALVAAAARFRWERSTRIAWIAWAAIALAGVCTGLRFFPRYYFLLLPVLVLAAARGFALLGRCTAPVALLLLIPLVRFAPAYRSALADPGWRDLAMDRDSRAAAALVRERAKPGDTLFVWGYRPELYVYTALPAATMYLDSQPLSGVPADRHLTDSTPVESGDAPRARRADVTRSRPAFIMDGLGRYNPRLAIDCYPDLRPWLAHYRPLASTAGTTIYERTGE
jgi:hypothetical protein